MRQEDDEKRGERRHKHAVERLKSLLIERLLEAGLVLTPEAA